MANALRELAEAGVAVWLDDLSRSRLNSGSLKKMVAQGDIVGITTNPTIFAKAIGEGAGYEAQLAELALRGTAIGEAVRLLTAYDVRAACDVLRSVYDATNSLDGRVSIEVDPRISQNAAQTAAEAQGLWWLVDRPNLFIKIPATVAGLPAIRTTIAAGISVNVTLIFSISRYRAVLDAYLSGLEDRVAQGLSLVGLESVASFFVSRVDVEVAGRLSAAKASVQAADVEALHGRVALANCILAYQAYEETLASDRWKRLAAKGGRMQRLLWASTGVKDKTLSDTLYVMELVGKDTVNTMPEATLQAVADHGVMASDFIKNRYGEAQMCLDKLAGLRIDLEDVASALEKAGLASFEASWKELIESVSKGLEKAGAKVTSSGAVTPFDGHSSAAGQPAAGPSSM